MKVIINGWEKPKNCKNCPFNSCDCWCMITRSSIDRDDYTTEEKCPIENDNSNI